MERSIWKFRIEYIQIIIQMLTFATQIMINNKQQYFLAKMYNNFIHFVVVFIFAFASWRPEVVAQLVRKQTKQTNSIDNEMKLK